MAAVFELKGFTRLSVEYQFLFKILLYTSFLICTYFLLRRNPRIKYHLSQLGGPPSIPLLGSLLYLHRPHKEYVKLAESWVARYGLIFGIWIANFIPYVFVADPNVIEKIISSSNHLDKGKYDYSLLHDWLGTGLLTAPRNKWFHRRKLLTPSFHFRILENFMPIFNEQASILLKCLEKGNSAGKALNIYPYLMKCTLDIICETAMGKKINAQTGEENKKYIDAVNGMCVLLTEKHTKPWLRIPIIYHLSPISRKENDYLKTMKQFTKQVIQSRKSERALTLKFQVSPENVSGGSMDVTTFGNAYGKRRAAFLDLLLDSSNNGSLLSDADIQEEVDTIMFEGHDTTGVSLVWTILLLAAHPECQELVRNELDEIFADDPERDLTTADLSRMKYLECCLKESLRLYPSVPVIMRQVDFDIPVDTKRIIPQRTTAIIALYFAHRHPAYFPEPEKFKPERFFPENQVPKRHSYSYLPFSAGPRNCIGQKFAMMAEKVVLAKLLWTYEIEAVDKMENVSLIPDIVLRCEGGLNVKLRKRSSN